MDATLPSLLAPMVVATSTTVSTVSELQRWENDARQLSAYVKIRIQHHRDTELVALLTAHRERTMIKRERVVQPDMDTPDAAPAVNLGRPHMLDTVALTKAVSLF